MRLPSDLDRLGRQLELAADGALRRRARRQRMLAALAALALTLGVLLTVGSGGARVPATTSPADADPAAALAIYEPASADNVAVRQAQGARTPSVPIDPACLDSNHCGRATPPMRLVSYPDPARRA